MFALCRSAAGQYVLRSDPGTSASRFRCGRFVRSFISHYRPDADRAWIRSRDLLIRLNTMRAESKTHQLYVVRQWQGTVASCVHVGPWSV